MMNASMPSSQLRRIWISSKAMINVQILFFVDKATDSCYTDSGNGR